MADWIETDGLGYWQDRERISAPHGFFSRLGGVSTGEIAGLNCGQGADDAPANVAENRRRAVRALGGDGLLQTVFQHHSPDVITVDAPFDERPKADALVTKTRGLPIGVLTADCAPVLLCDGDAGVIGAAHAGWRGAIGGVLENTIAAMGALGAERARIRAIVGPCISMNNYEVGAEFVEEFIAHDPQYGEYFSGGERIHFNLPRFVFDRLRAEEIESADWVGACTYGEPERYYSFRRATHQGEADYGRLIAAIMLP